MWVVVVDVEREESYWYPDDGGEVWVAGYYPVDADGRFMTRAELEALGLIATHVAGAVHRPEAQASSGAKWWKRSRNPMICGLSQDISSVYMWCSMLLVRWARSMMAFAVASAFSSVA